MSEHAEALTAARRTPASRYPAQDESSVPGRPANLPRDHMGLLVVLMGYLLTAAIIPVMTSASVSDDWVYALSVETLIAEGRLEISDAAGATAIPQIVWGALFAAVLDDVFGALRLATVAFSALSGLAFYGMCREIGISRGRSALGTALYLFNPVQFVLSYTFMSDPYFTGLLVVATLLFVRACKPGSPRRLLLVAGSVVTTAAFLQRGHGLLIAAAVALFLVVQVRGRISKDLLTDLLCATGLPAAAVLGLIVLSLLGTAVTTAQEGFLNSIVDAGAGGSLLLVERLAFIMLMYVGLFLLPLAVGVLPTVRGLVAGWSIRGRLFALAWYSVVLAGFAAFVSDGRLMPYIPHMLSRAGLGPDDLLIGRGHLVSPEWAMRLTVICGLSSLVIAAVAAHRLSRRRAPVPPAVAMLLVMAAGQVVGVLLPSFAFREWTVDGLSAPSLDRYLLPTLPLLICIALWALSEVLVVLSPVVVATAAMAVLSVLGTRDSLSFHGATWDLAKYANEIGIENRQLDAGFSWDAYHLNRFSRENDVQVQTPSAPWWVTTFAPATDSSYVIAAGRIDGWRVIHEVPYSLWLDPRETTLTLQRRPGVAGPP